jgi:hypothetical protein
MLNKKIIFTLLLILTISPPILAMDVPPSESSKAEKVTYRAEQARLNEELFDASCSFILHATASYTAKNVLALGAQSNAIDSHGFTPLACAAMNGNNELCQLLLDHNAQTEIKGKQGVEPLFAAICRGHDPSTITYPIFSPFLSEQEFKISRQRILAALCTLKRMCPSLPKDMRKLILCSLTELKNDVADAGIFGNFKNLTEEQTPHVPLPIVRLLIEKGKLDPDKTVAAIKAHHLILISPHCFVAIPHAKTPAIRALLHPDNLEQNFGFDIEWNIKKRLGLLKWPDKAIDTCGQKIVNWILRCRRRL